MTASLALSGLAAALELLLRATLLIAAAWMSAAALRRAGASAAARHLAWLLGISALLALPLLWWAAPVLRLPILPADAVPMPVMTAAGAAVSMPADSGDHWRWAVPFLAAYALGAAALLLRLALGRRLLARLWRDAGAPDEGWERLLARLASEMCLSRRVDLRIARTPVMPMTWGTRAPRILLPAEARAWPPERRRLVLLHELAHVARRDSLSRSVASLACALYWIHPGVWLAARRMRIEQEHAADDCVLAAGGSAQAYARSLLHLARGMAGTARPDLAASMAGMGQLERRLVSITTPARRDHPGRFFLSLSAAVAALAALVVAAGVPVSPSAAIPTSPRTRPLGIASAPAIETSVPAASDNISAPPAAPERGTAEDDAAPGPRRTATAPDSRSDAMAAGEDAPRSPAAPQAPAAQPLRDYGWQLPPRDLIPQAGSAPAFRSARLTVPAPVYSAPSDRSDGPKGPRIVPRIVLAGTQRGPSPVIVRSTTALLSWSIEVGPRP